MRVMAENDTLSETSRVAGACDAALLRAGSGKTTGTRRLRRVPV